MIRRVRVDAELLKKAQVAGRFRTGRDAVENALIEFIHSRRRQFDIFELAGTIDYDPTHNYKQQRSR